MYGLLAGHRVLSRLHRWTTSHAMCTVTF